MPEQDPRLACTCWQLLVEDHFRLHLVVPTPGQLCDGVHCACPKHKFSRPEIKHFGYSKNSINRKLKLKLKYKLDQNSFFQCKTHLSNDFEKSINAKSDSDFVHFVAQLVYFILTYSNVQFIFHFIIRVIPRAVFCSQYRDEKS